MRFFGLGRTIPSKDGSTTLRFVYPLVRLPADDTAYQILPVIKLRYFDKKKLTSG